MRYTLCRSRQRFGRFIDDTDLADFAAGIVIDELLRSLISGLARAKSVRPSMPDKD